MAEKHVKCLVLMAWVWLGLNVSRGQITRGSTEERWVWEESSSLAPLQTTSLLPLCEAHVKQTCLQKSTMPLSWEDAHSQCRSQNGFLASREEYPNIKLHWPKDWGHSNGNITWTALTQYMGHYQWLSRTPTLSDFEKWSDPPKNWSRECSAYNLTSEQFFLINCSRRLHFFCAFNNSEGNEDSKDEFQDMELVVTSNVQDLEGLIQISQNDSHSLMLTCQAYRKSTRELLPQQPQLFWRKDNVYIDYGVAGLEPATVHDSSKSEGKSNTLHQLAQGTYWCETWIPFRKQRLVSNKMFVSLKEWITAIFNAHRYEPNDYAIKQAKMDLNKSFVKLFRNINKFAWDLISCDKKMVNSSYSLANYSFHVHIPRNETNFYYLKYLSPMTSYKGVFSDNGYLETSNITYATLCYSETVSLNDGKVIEWPFTEAGFVHPKGARCSVSYGKLAPGLCKSDYLHGARVMFSPSDCEWLDLCPRGYISVEKLCVAVSPPDSWEAGFKYIYNTSQEISILDNDALLSKTSTFDYVKSLVRDVTNETKIWLPVKREQFLGPLVFKGPIVQDHKYQKYNEFSQYNITWDDLYPQKDKNCLTFDMEKKQLSTANCLTNHPFIAIVKSPFLMQFPPDQWNPLTTVGPNCATDYREACLCPRGWNTTIFKGEYETCFKLFTNTSSVTWSQAKKFCGNEQAQLPSPNVGFLDWVYRQHIYENNVQEVWMGVEWIPNRILYNGPVDVINWLPNTNYSGKYGLLKTEGWVLETEEKTVQDILCQQIIDPKVSLKLEINSPPSEDSQSMCIAVNPEQLLMDSYEENLKCYVNGIAVAHENTDDSVCPHELKVNGQGYYQCQGWSSSPFKLAKSNKILYTYDNTFTYVVTISHNRAYNPQYHDSTFVNEQIRMSRSKSCIEIIRKSLESSDLGHDLKFSNTYSYYWPAAKDNKLQQSFHLECKKNHTLYLEETELLERLSDILTVNNKFNDCTFERIRSTVGCLHDVTYDNSNGTSRNLTWTRTIGNQIVTPEELCVTTEGDPVTRECQGDFTEGYYWAEPAGKCTGQPSNLTLNLWKIKKNASSETVSSALANLTENSSSLQPIDIHFVSKTLHTLSRENSSFDNFHEIVRTVSNVMGANSTAFTPVLQMLNSSSTLLEALEDLTFKVQLPLGEGDKNIKASKHLLSVERLDLVANSTIIGFKSQGVNEETLMVGFSKEDIIDAENALILPSNLTYTVATSDITSADEESFKNKKIPVAFAVFQNEKLFQDNVSHVNYSVNSLIIFASYKGKYIKDLEEPVKILFTPKILGNDTKCVFWDFTMNNGRGGWSEEGCKVGEREGKHHVCLCNHLTNFAQLINYESNTDLLGPHALILDIITIVGCCLSIIGLLLVFTTFCLFKKWRRSLSNKILFNLSVSVFCSMVIYLAGINQTWNDLLCRSVAVGLHYFILASFGWMLVEAVHQYLKFVKVVGTYIPRFLWKASVCAWGIPVLPILVVLVYDHSLYDSQNSEYNQEYKICWMSVDGFKYAFLPPLVITMAVNVVMYCLIIYGAICGRARVNSTMSERTLFMNQLRMAVCVFFLLGFTWIFGLLAVCQLRPVFSYLFCIFNTLQGFFIFIFHVCREQGARKYWRDFLSVLTKDHVSLSTGNSLNQPNSNFVHGRPDSVFFDKCGGILVLPQGLPIKPHLRRTNRISLLSSQTNSTLIQSRNSFQP
ncbi:hypothetical protein SK128_003350 [Halocaridina rubra]|uniref:Uncharacterized protein n=1 Tax=Halocaridina rubra TaxID=373956 RepID=A0AAN8XL73_HALRR